MAVVKKLKIHVQPVMELVMKNKAHSVHIKNPAGVETGQQIRLAGQGEAGFNGGPYGDLYVVVSVEASDKFEREGTTIFYKLNLNIVQATLEILWKSNCAWRCRIGYSGGNSDWQEIPPTWQGAPSLRGGAVGDQYVTVNVVTPTGLNDRQKQRLKNSQLQVT